MTFTSWLFPAFVAASLLLYALMPRRGRWIVLLAASCGFYLCGGLKTAGYLLFTILTTYAAGLWLGRLCAVKPQTDKEKSRLKRCKKTVVLVTLLANFGMLYFLKYWSFTVSLLKLPFSAPERLLPLGVSFFIFQSVGYVVDCYRGKYPPEKNPAKYALFVSFFPQMVQGPISRCHDLLPQLTEGRPLSADGLKFGIQRAMWGYLKKLVIAERAGALVNAVLADYTSRSGSVLAVGIFFYCIQLYCDFSGGIDITVGVAEMFGIRLPENFRRPLFATSLADYWRRWHITLGQWMRDYVFYPLSLSKPLARLGKWTRKHIGGKPGKLIPASVATFTVYFIIGIWHGANLRYVFYGFWNGAIITASFLLEGRYAAWRKKLGIREKSPWWRGFQMLRTSLLVFFGRYLTRAPRLLSAFWMLAQLVRRPGLSDLWNGTLLNFGLKLSDILIVLAGQAAVLAVEAVQERGVRVRQRLEERNWLVQWMAILVPLAVILFFGILRGSYIPSAFIYQQY